MLDKKNNEDIDGFIEHRQKSLKKIVPQLDLTMDQLTRPERVAFSWLAEATQLYRLDSGQFQTRVLLLDFDEVLKDMETHLAVILKQLDIPFQADGFSRIMSSPVLNTYSKQPGFKYTQGNRQTIIKASMINNADAINKGMRFVENLATQHPVIDKVAEKIPLA